jgi:hypothetical protein
MIQSHDIMVGEAPRHLSREDIDILLALWHDLYDRRKNKHGRRSSGMTRDQLAEILVRRMEDEPRPFKTRAALNKHLTGLKKLVNSAPGLHDRQMIRVENTAAKSLKAKIAGHHRDVYTLAEGELITWPDTARIVIEVWNSDGHHIVEDVLLNRMLALNLKRGPEADAPMLDRQAILGDINWAIERKYIDRYGGNNIRGDGERSRLRFEVDFVSAIAEFCCTDDGGAIPTTAALELSTPTDAGPTT